MVDLIIIVDTGVVVNGGLNNNSRCWCCRQWLNIIVVGTGVIVNGGIL